MPKLVAITRPLEDAERLASAMAMPYIIEPMLTIKRLECAAETAKAVIRPPQAILLTSKHARFAAALCPKTIPILSVGSEGNTADALVNYIKQHLSPANGPLLYLSGEHTSQDIGQILSQNGFTVNQVIVYDAIATQSFSPEYCRHIEAQEIDTVLFFSRRTAHIYQQLVAQHQLLSQHATVRAICLSQNIGEALEAAQWKEIRIAEQPTEESLLKLLG